MSKCNNFNFSCARGQTQIDRGFDWSVACQKNDTQKNPVDLTGYTNKVIIKQSDGTLFAELIDVGGVGIDGVYTPDVITGIRYIQLSDTTTATMTDEFYVYEWEEYDSNSLKKLFMHGTIEVCKGSS